MFQRFYPHHEVDSAYMIDYESLLDTGLRIEADVQYVICRFESVA